MEKRDTMDVMAALEQQKLEDVCLLCQGGGGQTEMGDWSPCFRCNGAGYIPTEHGARILSLVQHYLESQACEAERANRLR